MGSKKISKKLSLNKLTVSHLGNIQAGAADEGINITATGCTCFISCLASCYDSCENTCFTCWEKTCPGWTNCAGGVAC